MQSSCSPPVRRQLVNFFEDSKLYHALVIGFVILDLGLVMADLGILLSHCQELPMSHTTETAANVLTWLSIAILAGFFAELTFQLVLFGLPWLKHWGNALDYTVVTVSFVLEVALKIAGSSLQEVFALLVVFRLWRLLRIIHATTEIIDTAEEERRRHAEARLQGVRKELAATQAQLEEARQQLAAAGLGPPADSSSTTVRQRSVQLVCTSDDFQQQYFQQ